MPDFEQMAADVVAAARGFVERAVSGLTKRVDDMEELVLSLDRAVPPKDGKDADPEFIRAEIAKAVAALPPPKDGKDVHPDTVALMVRDEVAKAVAALPKAKDGEPGRDATAIEPLPAIDSEKSYPRGTWAKHNGGLWLARARTDGMNGWDCIVDGVAGIKVQQGDDLRSATVTTFTSAGWVRDVTYSIPAVIDRGVYREGNSYQKGDGATWGGSFWIAQADTQSKPDAADGTWRLAVKKGRDAK